jgi:hypothetical protein
MKRKKQTQCEQRHRNAVLDDRAQKYVAVKRAGAP